ncbi:hypothetical protein ABIA99_006991 [Bradyrhizobium sp. LB12.1]
MRPGSRKSSQEQEFKPRNVAFWERCVDSICFAFARRRGSLARRLLEGLQANQDPAPTVMASLRRPDRVGPDLAAAGARQRGEGADMTTGTAWESILSNPSPSNGAQGSDLARPREPAHADVRILDSGCGAAGDSECARKDSESAGAERNPHGAIPLRTLDELKCRGLVPRFGSGFAKPFGAVDAKGFDFRRASVEENADMADGSDRLNLRSSLRNQAGLFARLSSVHVYPPPAEAVLRKKGM